MTARMASSETGGHAFVRLRARVHRLLSDTSRDPWARVVHWGLISLIVLNTGSIVLESVPAIGGRMPDLFWYVDIISVLVFTLEYLLRLWSAPEGASKRAGSTLAARLRFAATPLALVDLVAIVPFYIGLVLGLDGSEAQILRILRLLKLARYSNAFSMILNVLRREAAAIGATLAVLVGVLVVMASLMYAVEHDAQPAVFTDIPTTFWWAIATLTTVGYGDMVPITLAGRIIGGMTAVIGVGVIALPAGVLASGFLHELQLRRTVYSDRVEEVLADGVITPAERRMLNRLRDELEIEPEQAARLIEQAMRVRDLTCPHCGERVFEEDDRRV